MSSWKYYNHALIPTGGPHEPPMLDELSEKRIWDNYGKALFARWVEDWDCNKSTEWWYVIIDKPFDIASLKSKRRYEINKGNKNFSVEKIDPLHYTEDIYDIAVKAFSVYPKKYRPIIEKQSFIKDIKANWQKYTVFLAWNSEGKPSGYAYLDEKKEYADFMVLKTIPEEEKKGINAALVFSILEYYRDKLAQGKFYICDGSRAIFHDTNFQDYLIKYFNFRKAYCSLHIKYRTGVSWIIALCKPLKSLLTNSSIKTINQLAAVIKMDEIAKSNL